VAASGSITDLGIKKRKYIDWHNGVAVRTTQH
jgi:hypothetical protein